MHGKASLAGGKACARPGGEKQRVEAQPTKGSGLHFQGHGESSQVSEQKRDM